MKQRTIVGLCLTLAASAVIARAPEAQFAMPGPGASFTKLRINQAPVMEWQTGAAKAWKITGGGDIELVSEEGEGSSLHIRASTINVVFDAEEQPTRVEMRSHVVVDGPQGTIKADEADMDVSKQLLEFRGNVQVDSPTVKGLRADTFLYNLETGSLTTTNTKVAEVALPPKGGPSGGAQGGPGVVKESDVRDWGALLAAMKKAVGAKEPSPAARIVAMMDAEARKALGALDPAAAPNAKIKEAVLMKLNAVLAKADLYDEAAWPGTALSDAAADLVKQGPATLKQADLFRLNRMLAYAAFPDALNQPE